MITTAIDARQFYRTVWQAISCRESQTSPYLGFAHLSTKQHEALWDLLSFTASSAPSRASHA